MSWVRYAAAMLVFNVVGLLVVYVLQRIQQWLPLNPQAMGAVGQFRPQHGDQLRHEHQLAGLRW